MAIKALILVGIGLTGFFALRQTPKTLEKGIRHYLLVTFPEAHVKVRVSAPLLWFNSGNLDRISIDMAHFDASRFPVPIVGSVNSPQFSPDEGSGISPGPSDVISGVPSPATPQQRAMVPIPGKASTRWAQIESVRLHLSDFRFHGVHVTDFSTVIPGVRYDFDLAKNKHLLRLGGSQPGSLTLRLSEADINQAKVVDRPDIRNLHIGLIDGQVRLTLDYHTPVAWIPVSVSGRLVVEGGHSILFSDPAITAVHVTLPRSVTDYILDRVEHINPIFDLNRLLLPMDVSIGSLEIVSGFVTVHGSVQLETP